jgi:phage terminase small subunit
LNFPKPPSLKLVHGTDRKDRARESAELPKVDAELPPPSTLDAFGKTKWRELLTQYVAAGLMDKVDHIGLENLCMSYQRGRAYRKEEQRAEKKLRDLERRQEVALLEKDFDKFKAYSEMAAAANARMQAARTNQRRESQTTRQYLQEFGATPGSKRRLPPTKVEAADPLLLILEAGKKKNA